MVLWLISFLADKAVVLVPGHGTIRKMMQSRTLYQGHLAIPEGGEWSAHCFSASKHITLADCLIVSAVSSCRS